jgi:hypothetical protein
MNQAILKWLTRRAIQFLTLCECERFHVIGKNTSSDKKNDAAFDIPVNHLITKIMTKQMVDIAKQ